MWINIYASVHTQHIYHTCAWSQQPPKHVLWVLWIKPTHRFSLSMGQSSGTCLMSSVHGFKMFEKHWKLMASMVNLLVSTSGTNTKLLYSTDYSLVVLFPLGAVSPLLGWMRRHGVLSTSVRPHASAQWHPSASVWMEFPALTFVAEHPQLPSRALTEHIPPSIWLLAPPSQPSFVPHRFGGGWFPCGFYCCCFAFVFVLLLKLFLLLIFRI